MLLAELGMGLIESLLIGLLAGAFGGVLVLAAWWLTDANDDGHRTTGIEQPVTR